MSITGSNQLNLTNGPRMLFRLSAADMAIDTDQSFVKNGNFTTYVISEVVVQRVSGALGVACLGGIYTAASKGGVALIAAAQSYAALTGANTIVKDTLAAVLATGSYTATPILSLSTANTGALVADHQVFGYVLD